MDETPAVPPYDAPPPYEPPPPIEPPAGPPPVAVIPWEDHGRPWPGALVETVRLLFTDPRGAFERVPVRADVLRPVLFALVLGWIGVVFAAIWQLTLGDAMRGMLPPGAAAPDDRQRLFHLLSIPLGPLYVACLVLLNSALLHLLLLVLGGARNGYVATLRAVCYAQAAYLGLVLPFCGGFLFWVGVTVLEVIGLSVLHRIPLGKAIAAVIIPLVLCCTCIAIGIIMFGAALMGGGLKDLMP